MKKEIIVILILLDLISNFCFSQQKVTNTSDDSTNILKGFQKMCIETPYVGDYLYSCPPYPMPANDNVNSLIYWDKRYDFNKAEMNVYSTKGIKICSKERISISQQSDWSSIITWNASGFPFGIYIILIKHGSKTISVKVVIG